VSPTLAAITYDTDLLTLDEINVGIPVIIDTHGKPLELQKPQNRRGG
jgi:hypothetical protein